MAFLLVVVPQGLMHWHVKAIARSGGVGVACVVYLRIYGYPASRNERAASSQLGRASFPCLNGWKLSVKFKSCVKSNLGCRCFV